MSELDLDAIEARAEAATEGPWSPGDPSETHQVGLGGCRFLDADAEFIAHARADVPALVAAVRTLTAENERLRRWKAEAAEVLMQWESAYVAAGEPGSLGSRKSEAMAAEVKRLRGKVERLTSALERTELNFRSAVRGLPVRDMDENLAENCAALADPEESE